MLCFNSIFSLTPQPPQITWLACGAWKLVRSKGNTAATRRPWCVWPLMTACSAEKQKEEIKGCQTGTKDSYEGATHVTYVSASTVIDSRKRAQWPSLAYAQSDTAKIKICKVKICFNGPILFPQTYRKKSVNDEADIIVCLFFYSNCKTLFLQSAIFIVKKTTLITGALYVQQTCLISYMCYV